MSLSTEALLEAISAHSRGLGEAARGHLELPVEHCPGWDVAELVAHVTGVHGFWRTVVAERLSEPPSEERRPPRAPDDSLLDTFLEGAEALVATLRDADQSAECWTWATQKDVAFVTRHQVQEAAVHHWDAANASDAPWEIDPAVAEDCIDEFLTFSVSTDEDPVERPALDGALVLRTPGNERYVTDGETPGTVRVTAPPGEIGSRVAVAQADPADVLLWLYARIPDVQLFRVEDAPLLTRFRALCFTD